MGGYSRRNPISKGTEPAAKEGGDQTPGGGPNSRKDSAHVRRDALSELGYTLGKLRAANENAESPAIVRLPAEELTEQDAA